MSRRTDEGERRDSYAAVPNGSDGRSTLKQHPGVRIAVDVGGTFTDVFAFDEDANRTWVAKVPSSADPIDGIMSGVTDTGVQANNVSLFSHASTVATNALITRSLGQTMMVTTAGFRDIIEIRRGTREDLWELFDDPAPPHIRRRDRLEVRERVDYSGRVSEPLVEDDARQVARILRRCGADSVAICFINSYANPENEVRMKQILEEELPNVPMCASAQVVPEIFEYERFSTTVINAALAPLVAGYVQRLEGRLREAGYSGDLLLLHSGGGVMTPKGACEFPARLAASGLAAGAIASRHIARECGFSNAIALDMGGTSSDISLVHGGEAETTKQWFVEWGHPISFPSIDIRTIGAGGGSLAWIDEGGSLRNGPQSAGADPGPACYGRGNEKPTDTDANLVLGRLGDVLLDGAMTLDLQAATEAIAREVGAPLGLATDEAAQAIITVANANMADALRLMSIRRGYDPREFVLVVYGGAGPLHGAALARDLDIPRVVVPPHPGVTSALGCLLVDIQHDVARMFVAKADRVDVTELENAFRELEAEAQDRLVAEKVADGDMLLQRAIDMRYTGQWRSLTVPADAPVTSLEDVLNTFHSMHEREHRYRRDEAAVEIYRLSVRAIGLVPKPEFPRQVLDLEARPRPTATRPVLFDGMTERVDTPIFARRDLPPGTTLVGPTVIEQLDSTVLVPPGVDAEIDEWMNIQLTIST